MPTVGWIQETAIDRYWEQGGLGDQYPPAPAIYYCPYCVMQFDSTRDLSTHISVDHPIERPMIFISNRVALSEQTIRSPISKNAFNFTHVNRIKVSRDGSETREWSQDKLIKHLSNNQNAHYSITLINDDSNNSRSVEARYIIKVKIADQSELDAVDAHFVRALAIDDVKMSDVRRFSDDCNKYSGAGEYSSALAVYVIGVLIKDQNVNTGITQPLYIYKDKMQQALETLHDYDRPVPRAICASIKFNLNDFKRPPLQCGSDLIDAANDFFHAVARGYPVRLMDRPSTLEREFNLPACPIDRDSFDLLSNYLKICGGNIERSLITELSESCAHRSMSDYDLSKLRVLTAYAAIRAQDTAAGSAILEDLVNDPVFGNWAESQLAG